MTCPACSWCFSALTQMIIKPDDDHAGHGGGLLLRSARLGTRCTCTGSPGLELTVLNQKKSHDPTERSANHCCLLKVFLPALSCSPRLSAQMNVLLVESYSLIRDVVLERGLFIDVSATVFDFPLLGQSGSHLVHLIFLLLDISLEKSKLGCYSSHSGSLSSPLWVVQLNGKKNLPSKPSASFFEGDAFRFCLF